MSDWSGSSYGIASPGYSSKYCLYVRSKIPSGVSGYVTNYVINTKYPSVGILSIFYIKGDYVWDLYKVKLLHTGYDGNPVMFSEPPGLDITDIIKNNTDWVKLKVVWFFDEKLGKPVGLVFMFDEDSGEWVQKTSKTYNINEPKSGNIGWAIYSEGNLGRIYIDNIEIYVWKDVKITKEYSETESISTST